MTPKRLYITGIHDRVIKCVENFPEEPERCVFGTPIYTIRVRLDGKTRLLELYHHRVINQLKSTEELRGRKVMIQLPEQEGAEWGVRVIS